MSMCKKYVTSKLYEIHIFIANKAVGFFRHLTLKKSFKRFITEYINDVRTIISYTYHDCFLKNYLRL